jgi:triosephosphate isomerase
MIAGNWKMNGTFAGAIDYAAALRAAKPAAGLIICPPFPLLAAFAVAFAGTGIALGAQDCHARLSGAHTGDVSAALIRESGAAYVILGHSERRADHGETNATVAAKTEAAIAAGLIPIVCVGETEAARDAGEAEDVVKTQLRHSLPAEFNGLVAYEPVWAIGTGQTASPAVAQEMHALIREVIADRLNPDVADAMRILYGGSVKPENACELLCQADIDGALVGGASLKPESLAKIIHYEEQA